MTTTVHNFQKLQIGAAFGGIYGNVPALKACLQDAKEQQCEALLFESELDEQRLLRWLDQYQVVGFICTHSGFPWIRYLKDGRFAANCGVVGKPDNDGDPAIHYLIVTLAVGSVANIVIQRIEYDYLNWIQILQREGVDSMFIEPLHTGIWTYGLASLPTKGAKNEKSDVRL